MTAGRLRRLRYAWQKAQAGLQRGDPVGERYARLLRALRPSLEAVQRGEPVDDDTRRLCLAVATDAALLARKGAEASGQARDPATARQVLAAFRDALACAPGDPGLCHNLGGYLNVLGQWDAAIACFEQAVDETQAGTWVALGYAHAYRGRAATASHCWQQALRIAARRGAPDFSVAPIRLARGDWARGWVDYEARETVPFGPYRSPSTAPKWDGSRVERLLVYGEQGVGDLVMMLRYLPLAAARCGQLIVRVPRERLPLVTTLAPFTPAPRWAVVPDDEDLPDHDARISWMSFPAVFRTVPTTVPRAHAIALSHMAIPRRLGICWRGDPRHPTDHVRSMPEAAMAAIVTAAQAAGWSIQSLQYGQAFGRGPIPVGDWTETIACVASCEQVVTVDTSIAHLAGALGVPTLLCLPEPAEWRWLTGTDRSVWYPQDSFRLIRQATPGGWVGVVDRVIAALRERAV